MLSLVRCRAVAARSGIAASRRVLSTSTAASSRRRARLGVIALTGVLGSSAFLYLQKPLRADAEDDDWKTPRRRPVPLTTLLRSYIVYSMCSVPMLVDWSPSILAALSSVPGLKQITEALVRVTFFSQFVGGDTAHECVPLLEKFRAENKGCLFAYSVEVDEYEAAGKSKSSGSGPVKAVQPVHKRIVDEMIRCIDVAADFEDQRAGKDKTSGRRTWVAIKLTALVRDAQAFLHLSSHLVKSRPALAHPVCFPGSPRPSDFDILNVSDASQLPEMCPLTKEDLIALKELKDDLFRVCQRAKERGVRVIIDAEHTWYQPAIDAYQFALMREFNRLPGSSSSPSPPSLSLGQEGGAVQPLIYGTFQAYLRRTPDQLAQSLRDAEAGGFSLGVKLVRGAYHSLEAASHGQAGSLSISPEAHAPVWLNKLETDACFNACVRVLVGRVADELKAKKGAAKGAPPPKTGILFGTHNWGSCTVVLDELVHKGLAAREGEGEREVVRIGDDVAERVTLGQLYGMSDALTDSLVDRTRTSDPFVIKYVPYGALSEVMPYLGRRAIENKSVLGDGAAVEERRRAGAEIVKRFRGFFA